MSTKKPAASEDQEWVHIKTVWSEKYQISCIIAFIIIFPCKITGWFTDKAIFQLVLNPPNVSDMTNLAGIVICIIYIAVESFVLAIGWPLVLLYMIKL